MQSPVQGVAGGYRTWNHGLCSDMESGAQNYTKGEGWLQII